MIKYIRPPTMLGFHVSIGSRNGFGDFLKNCAAAGRAVSGTKCFKNGGGLETTAASNRSYVVFRTDVQYHFPNGKWDEYSDNPPYDYSWPPDQSATIARGWMEGCWRIWQYNPAHFYELMNEPNPATELQMANLITFSRECMKLADEQYHIKLAIGGFSSGTPTEAFIEMMSPLLDEMAQQGHILALHDGAATPDYVLFKDAYDEGSALRWRLWESIQNARNRLMPFVFGTEVYCPEFYHEYGKSERQQDMLWYYQECAKDKRLLGTALFELGEYNFGGGSVNLESAIPTIQDIVMQLVPIESEPPVPPPSTSIMLDIPYFNQNNLVSANDSSSDCGPACLAMLLASRGLDVTVNQVFARTGAMSGRPISFAQMKTAAASYGYSLEDRRGATLEDLRVLLQEKTAPILLVNASFLNQPGKMNPYLGAHYVTLVGETSDGFLVHDPNNLPATIQPDLAMAWGNPNGDNPANAMLILREGAPIPPTPSMVWRGLQLRNGDVAPADWNCVIVGKLDAVKFTTDTAIDDLYYACTLVLPSHILLRLFMPGDDPALQNPITFASMFGIWLDTFAAVGGWYVEIHNEPNLYIEGLGQSWHNGLQFSDWLIAVLAELRRRQPALKYGFPGLSPGGYVQDVRRDEMEFYYAARPAVAQCDWLGVHCYWLTADGMNMVADGAHYRIYKNEGKPLIITEFSNPDGSVSKAEKGRQYKAYYASLPSYVVGAFSFISSADNPAFISETWVGSEIPEIVGA